MPLLSVNGEEFTSGELIYSASDAGASTRIVIEVRIDGWRTEAIVDTGAPFLICSPELAEQLALNNDDALMRDREILIRGAHVGGSVHRVSVTIPAATGTGLSLEVTAFVPDAEKNFGITHPTFLGYAGCLERIRFAIDPSTQTFHFGPQP